MRKLTLAIAAAAAVLAGPALQAKPRLTPEQRLDKMLAGREAGKPVSCISSWDQRDMEVLDKTAIVFRAGSTIYVNRPANAADLDSDDILVTRSHTGQLCKIDIVTTVDRSGHFQTGFVNLGEFVPYRRISTAARD